MIQIEKYSTFGVTWCEVGNDIHLHTFSISSHEREKLMGHSSCVVWFTGLSGSGKSTISNEVESALFKKKLKTFCLDGDNLRLGLNSDLGFSQADRAENIRRVGEVAKLLVDAGIIVLASFVSPSEKDRQAVRSLFSKGKFIEVFVDCSVEICEARDPKGLYKKARAKEISNMTGIDSDYEKPKKPEIIIDSGKYSIEENVTAVLSYLKTKHQFGE